MTPGSASPSWNVSRPTPRRQRDRPVFALQSLLVAVVLCVALAVGRVLWRRSHKPG